MTPTDRAHVAAIYYMVAIACSYATPFPWWQDALGLYALGVLCHVGETWVVWRGRC